MNPLIWLLPIASGLGDAFQRGAIKLTSVHRLTLIAVSHIFALPFLGIWLWIEGIPKIQEGFWIAPFFHIPLMLWAAILAVEAHRSSKLTLTAPYLALTPAYLLVISPFAGGGNPTWIGGLGVLIIIFGVYVLNTRDEQKNVGRRIDYLAPFKNLSRDRGSRLMLLVGLIYSVTAILDKLGMVRSSPAFYPFFWSLFLGLLAALAAVIYRIIGKATKEELNPVGSFKPLALNGFFISLTLIPQYLGLKLISVVPYVIAGKRLGVVLFSVAIGITLGLMSRFGGKHSGEVEDLKYRLSGTLIMVLGMLLIIFWGKIE
ncbi:hypothetical protein A3B18_02770 [Candidatus Giovannonibacteria bacterium RIFCSPLOWO2_01_FULL_46_13]|uniref:EamA domain-containing protein n=1 Tax=Candidatus Giovannonibacteria bacterium RIFCSPLOWO2_01_FULL_46_13 TaxID=1798352 RepID=A0A1F5X2U1_9BACT|nr:MAG: hypothetical protein A3B18_02770 [Candidatus Giovannonibacteria bacterium RIFCSPLOWO2_01_FULL_46_13]